MQKTDRDRCRCPVHVDIEHVIRQERFKWIDEIARNCEKESIRLEKMKSRADSIIKILRNDTISATEYRETYQSWHNFLNYHSYE